MNVFTLIDVPLGKRVRTSDKERFDVSTPSGFTRALVVVANAQGESIGRNAVLHTMNFAKPPMDKPLKKDITHWIQQAEAWFTKHKDDADLPERVKSLHKNLLNLLSNH